MVKIRQYIQHGLVISLSNVSKIDYFAIEEVSYSKNASQQMRFLYHRYNLQIDCRLKTGYNIHEVIPWISKN